MLEIALGDKNLCLTVNLPRWFTCEEKSHKGFCPLIVTQWAARKGSSKTQIGNILCNISLHPILFTKSDIMRDNPKWMKSWFMTKLLQAILVPDEQEINYG